MPNRLTQIHTTAYLNPKDDRRGLLSPKLTKVFGKSRSPEPQLERSASLSEIGRSSTPSSFNSLSTVSQGSQRRSKTSKIKQNPSPQVVSSIINGMYAYPANRLERTLSPLPDRDVVQPSPNLTAFLEPTSSRGRPSPSPPLKALFKPSTSISEISRTSSDTRLQQPSRPVHNKNSNIRSGNVEGASGTSSEPNSFQSSRTIDKPVLNIHPIPPHLSYQIANYSSETVSSIHFVGETGSPSTPFFPSDRSTRSARHSLQISLSPSFSASSSTFIISPSTSTMATSISEDDPAAETETDEEEVEPSKSVEHRQRSLNKLTRTLGDIPPDAHRVEPSSCKEHSPTQNTPSKKDRNAKAFRRASLSITNLSSIFVRPSGRRRDSIASQQTMSTLTDDLHRFGMEDDLSERWGYRDGLSADLCDSPGSPIMFAPPSPLPIGDHAPNSGLGSEQADHSPSLSSPTLARSHSYTTASRRRGVYASHNHSASASNWIIPPPADDDEIAFAMPRNVQEKPQAWTGEWNSDIQDVIKSLRTLR